MTHAFYKTIKGRFLIITATIMLIIGIGTSTFALALFSKNLRSNQIHSLETSLQLLGNTIDTNIADILLLSQWSSTNNSMVDFVMTDKSQPSYNAITSNSFEALNQACLRSKAAQYIQRVIVANKDRSDHLQITSTQLSTAKDVVGIIQELPYYSELIEDSDYKFQVGLQTDPFLRRETNMLPVIHPVYHPYENRVVGFSYIQIAFELFTDPLCDYAKQEGSPVYLTLADTTYKITGNNVKKIPSDAKSKKSSYNDQLSGSVKVYTVSSDNASKLFVSLPLETADCSISIPVSNVFFNQSFGSYLIILLFILLIALIIGILMYFSLNRTVTRPIAQIQTRIDAVAHEDFEPDHTIEWDNELGDIGKNVNQLATDIQQLMDQKINFEKQKKDYEYQVLQSQISPHFLYNTLNSIKWMATIQNAPGIAEMTTALAHLLKYISKGTSTIVSLDTEITLLNDYYTIQKYRYGGAINMIYDIEDPGLKDIQILRFTLQPIVENAIFHGIEPKGKNGTITIHIFHFNSNQVKIEITDDGIGMDDETIRQIFADETSEKSHFFRQIGIGSVNKRIKYNFGMEYGLSIQSVPGEYTTMTILLPEIYQLTKGE